MPTPHEELFAKYCDDLQEAKTATLEWWSSLLKREEQVVGDHQQALANVQRRWPRGPVTHPFVVAVVRKYYFACEALNEEMEKKAGGGEPDHVYPHYFVTELLMDGEHDELLEFIAPLPYLPIGLDQESHFV
jgi:hypothetical protein